MRYFTKEQWAGWQEAKPTRDWTALWKRNVAAYRRQLARLRPRLSAAAFSFFIEHSLHDGELTSLLVTDNADARSSRPASIDVSMVIITGGQHRFEYTLHYRMVERLVIDHPSAKPMFLTRQRGFADWGYDELTVAKRLLRHEILFSAGSTILLEFHGFNWKRQRLRGKSPSDARRTGRS